MTKSGSRIIDIFVSNMINQKWGLSKLTHFAKSIKLFLMDMGDPNGRWLCEMSGWTGVAYKIPRIMVSSCSDRPELNRCAVYFLFGYDIEKDKPSIYIGETEEVLVRLKTHVEKRDNWTEAIVFISKDDHLNKAHIKYLEHRFYKIAKETGRYFITNDCTPKKSSVSEGEVAELEEFIYNAKILVNTLGHKAFEEISRQVASDDKKSAGETLYLKAKGITATALATYTAYTTRSEINEKLKVQIKDLCPILIKGSLKEAASA